MKLWSWSWRARTCSSCSVFTSSTSKRWKVRSTTQVAPPPHNCWCSAAHRNLHISELRKKHSQELQSLDSSFKDAEVALFVSKLVCLFREVVVCFLLTTEHFCFCVLWPETGSGADGGESWARQEAGGGAAEEERAGWDQSGNKLNLWFWSRLWSNHQRNRRNLDQCLCDQLVYLHLLESLFQSTFYLEIVHFLNCTFIISVVVNYVMLFSFLYIGWDL